MGSTGSAGTPAWCHGVPTPPLGFGVRGTRGALAVPRGHAPRRGRADDREVPVPVRPVDPHPGARQPGHEPPGRVPVGVVRADGDERHPGAAGRQEGGVGVRAPVVGNLQHVRAQVGPGRQDARLGPGAEITGEQHPHPTLGDPDDHRQVVRLGGRGGPLRRRGEHLDVRRPHRSPVPGHQHHALPAAAADEALERPHPGAGHRGRRGERPVDGRPGHAAWSPHPVHRRPERPGRGAHPRVRDRPERGRAEGAAPRERGRRPGLPRGQRRPGGADLGRGRQQLRASHPAAADLAGAGRDAGAPDRPRRRPRGRRLGRVVGSRGAGRGRPGERGGRWRWFRVDGVVSVPRDTMQACRPTPSNPPPASVW